MFNAILNNLGYIGAMFGIFVLCVIANMVASVYYNVGISKSKWDWKKFWNGVKKMLAIGVGSGLLAVIPPIILFATKSFNITIPDDITSVVNTAAITAIYFFAIKKYFVEALNTIKDILNNRNVIDDIEGKTESNESVSSTTVENTTDPSTSAAA